PTAEAPKSAAAVADRRPEPAARAGALREDQPGAADSDVVRALRHRPEVDRDDSGGTHATAVADADASRGRRGVSTPTGAVMIAKILATAALKRAAKKLIEKTKGKLTYASVGALVIGLVS